MSIKPFRVTVYCSANVDIEPRFYGAATEFAKGLAGRGWELIYGGARVGLMGRFADEMLKAGGVVRGAITEDIARGHEGVHEGLTELVVVKDLFERKRWMMDHADAFAVFPGGLGTLVEALEAITFKALIGPQRPILFVNLFGFWQAQIKAFQELALEGMIRAEGGLTLYDVCETVDETWAILDGASKDLVRE